jgi:hypothetical protein
MKVQVEGGVVHGDEMGTFEEDYAPWAESDHHDEMDVRFGWGLRNNEVHHLKRQVEELAAAFTVVWISACREGWDAKAIKHFDALVELHNAEITGAEGRPVE